MPLMSPLNIHTKHTKRALLVVISAPTCGVLSCVHKYTSPVVYITERVTVSDWATVCSCGCERI